jgi:hypothetical protein
MARRAAALSGPLSDRDTTPQAAIKRQLIVFPDLPSFGRFARVPLCVPAGRFVTSGLVAAPLTQIQTVEQMMAQQRNRPRSTSEVPPEIQTKDLSGNYRISF